MELEALKLTSVPVHDQNYVSRSLQAFPATLPDGSRQAYGADVARQARSLDEASEKLKGVSEKANSFKRTVVEVDSRASEPRFFVQRVGGRITAARVDVVALDARGVADEGAAPTAASRPFPLGSGAKPPYVAMLKPPSIDDCVDIFTLSPDQAVPFALLAQLLLDEKAGRRSPQRRVIISGKPGSGKSQARMHRKHSSTYSPLGAGLILVSLYIYP